MDLEGVKQSEISQTEWNKSKREKQILYINTYMWNLEKWLRWSYLQIEIETDVENKYMDTKQGKGWDELGDWDGHIYTIDTTYKTGN